VGRALDGALLAPGTDVERSVRTFLALRPPRGVVVLTSDLPDPSWSRAADHLIHARHDVGIVHLQTPGELEFPGERFDLVDGETGVVMPGVTRQEIVGVRTSIKAERDRITKYAKARGIPLVQTVTGAPTDLEHLVLGLFRSRGILR
jgi:hypothetical protein